MGPGIILEDCWRLGMGLVMNLRTEGRGQSLLKERKREALQPHDMSRHTGLGWSVGAWVGVALGVDVGVDEGA